MRRGGAHGAPRARALTKLRLVDQLVWMRSIAWLELAAGLLLSAFAFNYMSAQVAREVRANFIAAYFK